jgi:type VI secretion system secreted protein VgrG
LGDSTLDADAPTITVSGTEVTICGSSKITLDGGGSTIVIDASGVTIDGAKVALKGSAAVELNAPAITSAATGVNTITGATVKLN